MLTVAVVAIGIFGVAVVLPLVLVRRMLPSILIADELDEYRQEVRASRANSRSSAAHAGLSLHVAHSAGQQGSSVA